MTVIYVVDQKLNFAIKIAEQMKEIGNSEDSGGMQF
jgi:hypothetical protein